MIAEGISRAQRNFDAYLEENIDMDWDAQRNKIYEHFGLTPRGVDKSSNSTNSPEPGIKGSFGRSVRGGREGPTDRSRLNTPSRSVFGRSGMQKSVIGTPGARSVNATAFGEATEKPSQAMPVQDDRFIREKQVKFAEKVQALNESRLRGYPHPVLQDFAGIEGQAGGDVSLRCMLPRRNLLKRYPLVS